MSEGILAGARSGWADPDTRTAGLIVIGAVGLLAVFGRVFRDVNPS